MTKKILLTATAIKGIAILVTAFIFLGAGCTEAVEVTPTANEPPPQVAPQTGKRGPILKVEDSIFVIDGKPTQIAPIFGTPVSADLDADGDMDAAVILTQDNGGSGTFYYVAASINEAGEYRGTGAILLGDRIAPQTLEVHDGLIVANYAERKPGEPMTTMPSVGVSKYFRIQQGALVGVEKP